jgi:hypothetical protein
MSVNREEAKEDLSDSEEDELVPQKNVKIKNDIWGLIMKIAIIVTEITLIFLFMTILDASIAFDLVEANVIVGLAKLTIFTYLIVNRLYSFGKLLNITVKYDDQNLPNLTGTGHRVYGNAEKISQIPTIIPFIIIFGVIYVFPVMYMVTGTCICQVNEAIPGYVFHGKHITTAWTRSQYEEVCLSNQQPCHVYATLPEDALTQAYISFHINQKSCFENG